MRQVSPRPRAVRRAAPTPPPGWSTAPMASAAGERGGADRLAASWLVRRRGRPPWAATAAHGICKQGRLPCRGRMGFGSIPPRPFVDRCSRGRSLTRPRPRVTTPARGRAGCSRSRSRARAGGGRDVVHDGRGGQRNRCRRCRAEHAEWRSPASHSSARARVTIKVPERTAAARPPRRTRKRACSLRWRYSGSSQIMVGGSPRSEMPLSTSTHVHTNTQMPYSNPHPARQRHLGEIEDRGARDTN
jgi:hypothetical protein